MKYLHWPQPLLQLLKVSIHFYQILYEVPESAVKRQPCQMLPHLVDQGIPNPSQIHQIHIVSQIEQHS